MKNLRVLTKQKLAIIVVMITVAGCAMDSGQQTAGPYVDDTTITRQVQAALLSDPALKVIYVTVESQNGAVQLNGFVDSPSTATKAVHLARSVQGVKSVKDNMLTYR